MLIRHLFFHLFIPQVFAVCSPCARHCTGCRVWKKSSWARHIPTTVRHARAMPRFVPDAVGLPGGQKTMGEVYGNQRANGPRGPTAHTDSLRYLPTACPHRCALNQSSRVETNILPMRVAATLVQDSSHLAAAAAF